MQDPAVFRSTGTCCQTDGSLIIKLVDNYSCEYALLKLFFPPLLLRFNSIRHSCPTVLFFSTILLGNAVATQTNRTIDDQLGDGLTGAKVEYLPTSFEGGDIWKFSSSCPNCAIHPDSTKAFNNTWTSSTYFSAIGNISAGFNFQGTAIYIFFIESNYPTSTGLVSTTTCGFNLDGQVVGQYEHATDESYNFQCDVLAYSNSSLTNGNHTFLIETSGSDRSFVIFDYAIYTRDTLAISSSTTSSAISISSPTSTSTSTPPKHKVPIGAIVGGAIGGIAVIVLIILALVLYRRRKRTQYPGPTGGRKPRSKVHLIDLTEITPGPRMTARQANLELQITEQRQAMNELEKRGQLWDRNDDGLDVRQQMEEMKAQIRRLETQQQSMWAINGQSSGGSSSAPSSTPFTIHSGDSTSALPGSSQTRSLSMMKRDQTLAVQNSSPQLQPLLHVIVACE